MAGKKGNKAHANETSFTSESEKGNKAAEKWTESEAVNQFAEMYKNAQTDKDVLCLQDVYLKYEMRSSTFDYLINKFPVLEAFKKDMQNAITSRINRGAILGEFQQTASIWRMKQLGETDKTVQETINHNV